MSLQILRAIFDSNIFVQILLNPSSVAAKCFDLVEDGRVSLFVSDAIIDEVRDVVFRPHIVTRLPDATEEQITSFIEEILHISTLRKTVPGGYSFDRDPKDEMIINLAVACKADYIVSRDKNLLDLMTGFDDKSKEFRQRFRRLKIVEPVEFLNILATEQLPLKP